MLKTIIKLLVFSLNLYLTILYWLYDQYKMDMNSLKEVYVYYNAFYFGGAFLVFGVDFEKKSLLNLYVSLSVLALIGFLMPTLAGEIAGYVFTLLAVLLFGYKFKNEHSQ